MEKRATFRKLFIGFPVIAVCISTLFFIADIPAFFSNHPHLSLAITIDFLVIVPSLYWLTIRKTSIPNITVVPVLVLSMLLCGLALPENRQWYLNGFEQWIFPFIELTVISFVVWKLRKVVLGYKASRVQSVDFFSALKEACADVLPKSVVIPFATEIAVFYYGFIAWKKRTLTANEFSYHKESGTVTLLFAIVGIVTIEMVTVHVLLGKWSAMAVWILTVLSAYSGLQIFGFAKGVSRRPIVIEDGQLKLRYSFLKEADIPFEHIKEVRLETKDLNPEENIAKLSLLHDLEGHNVILELEEPATLHGMYGSKKQFTKIALHIDRKEDFRAQVQNNLP
ncbi:MAG: hypothetical protein NXI10_09020 [bacterium]|nr:hypothetical protein [bacterium]